MYADRGRRAHCRFLVVVVLALAGAACSSGESEDGGPASQANDTSLSGDGTSSGDAADAGIRPDAAEVGAPAIVAATNALEGMVADPTDDKATFEARFAVGSTGEALPENARIGRGEKVYASSGDDGLIAVPDLPTVSTATLRVWANGHLPRTVQVSFATHAGQVALVRLEKASLIAGFDPTKDYDAPVGGGHVAIPARAVDATGEVSLAAAHTDIEADLSGDRKTLGRRVASRLPSMSAVVPKAGGGIRPPVPLAVLSIHLTHSDGTSAGLKAGSSIRYTLDIPDFARCAVGAGTTQPLYAYDPETNTCVQTGSCVVTGTSCTGQARPLPPRCWFQTTRSCTSRVPTRR